MYLFTEKANKHWIHVKYPYEYRVSNTIKGNFRIKSNFLYEPQPVYVSQMIQPMYHQQPVRRKKSAISM